MVLKWICFIIVCLDTVSYIAEQTNRLEKCNKTAEKAGSLLGLCIGIVARVYVLYGAGTCWLTV